MLQDMKTIVMATEPGVSASREKLVVNRGRTKVGLIRNHWQDTNSERLHRRLPNTHPSAYSTWEGALPMSCIRSIQLRLCATRWLETYRKFIAKFVAVYPFAILSIYRILPSTADSSLAREEWQVKPRGSHRIAKVRLGKYKRKCS